MGVDLQRVLVLKVDIFVKFGKSLRKFGILRKSKKYYNSFNNQKDIYVLISKY